MDRSTLRWLLLAGGAASAFLWSPEASAQEQADTRASTVEEIVVTARRREENLQETPVSITAVTADTLEARGVISLEEISRIAPNMRIEDTPGSTGAAGVSIRGIGYADNVIGQDSPIGIYIDGVASNRISTSVMDLVEPERVEVLRGPQGTLFGRNTTGGAILITSHMPTDDFSGQVRASYGTWQAMTFQGRVDTGLLGNTGLKASFAYQHRQQNGSQNNLQQPRRLDPGAEESDSYWFKVAGDWDRFRFALSGDYTEQTAVPVMLQIVEAPAGLRNVFANSPNFGGTTLPITRTPLYTVPNYAFAGEQRVWSQGLALTAEFDLTENLTVKSITGLRAYKRKDPAAYGPSDVRVPVTTSPALPPTSVRSFNGTYGFLDRQQSQRQLSEELQLLGTVGDFNFVAGGYYFDEEAWDLGITRLISAVGAGASALDVIQPRLYDVSSKSKAVFAQVDWRPGFLDERLELSGGVRYTEDTRTFNQTLALLRSVKLKTENTSYLASANYQWTEGLMTYARFSTGYRAGGFNVRSTPPTDPVFQPEKIKAYEAGFKLDAWNRRFRLNASAFYNKYRDLQVGIFVPPSAGGGGGGGITFNANANYKGVELETVILPVEGLTLTGALGLLDVDYKDYPQALGPGGTLFAGCSPIPGATGTTVAQNCANIADSSSPKRTADLSATYAFPATSYGELSVAVDYSYRGPIEWAALATPALPHKEAIRAKGYGLLGARVALSDIPLSGDVRGQIALFGRNLTDEDYITQGIDFGLFGTVNWGERRTFGIEGKVEF